MKGALLVAAALSLPAHADWPQFRGPEGQGHAAGSGFPLEWSETRNVRWKTRIHGRAWSSDQVCEWLSQEQFGVRFVKPIGEPFHTRLILATRLE